MPITRIRSSAERRTTDMSCAQNQSLRIECSAEGTAELTLPVSVTSEKTIVAGATFTSVEWTGTSLTNATAPSIFPDDDQASSAKPTGGNRVRTTTHTKAKTSRSEWRPSVEDIRDAHGISRLVPRDKLPAFSGVFSRAFFDPRAVDSHLPAYSDINVGFSMTVRQMCSRRPLSHANDSRQVVPGPSLPCEAY